MQEETKRKVRVFEVVSLSIAVLGLLARLGDFTGAWKGTPHHPVPESRPPPVDATPTVIEIPQTASASPSLLALLPARPEKAWGQPHVTLHLARESQRPAALRLKQRLHNTGCVIAGPDGAAGNAGVPTRASELRFFNPGDADEARRLAQEAAPLFGNAGLYAALPGGATPASHARQYEIWFSSAYHAPEEDTDHQAAPLPAQIATARPEPEAAAPPERAADRPRRGTARTSTSNWRKRGSGRRAPPSGSGSSARAASWKASRTPPATPTSPPKPPS